MVAVKDFENQITLFFVNSFLIVKQIQSLTADGGKLKCSVPLVRGRDFEIVPESVWKALIQWYTGSPALPRNVSNLGSLVECMKI